MSAPSVIKAKCLALHSPDGRIVVSRAGKTSWTVMIGREEFRLEVQRKSAGRWGNLRLGNDDWEEIAEHVSRFYQQLKSKSLKSADGIYINFNKKRKVSDVTYTTEKGRETSLSDFAQKVKKSRELRAAKTELEETAEAIYGRYSHSRSVAYDSESDADDEASASETELTPKRKCKHARKTEIEDEGDCEASESDTEDVKPVVTRHDRTKAITKERDELEAIPDERPPTPQSSSRPAPLSDRPIPTDTTSSGVNVQTVIDALGQSSKKNVFFNDPKKFQLIVNAVEAIRSIIPAGEDPLDVDCLQERATITLSDWSRLKQLLEERKKEYDLEEKRLLRKALLFYLRQPHHETLFKANHKLFLRHIAALHSAAVA